MTGQEQAVLGILLMTDGYISYETLAEKLNVSSRTVMRLIRSMETFLKDFSIKVEVKRRRGIRLDGAKKDLEALRQTLELEKTVNYTANDRILLILLELYQSEEFVKIYYLAYLLNVSAGTIQRDLEEVRLAAEKNGVMLVSQRGEGIRLRGGLHKGRQALAKLFRRYLDLRSWSAERQDMVFLERLSGNVRKELLEFLDMQGLYRTYKLITDFDYTLTDSFLQEDFQNLVLYTHILLHFPKLKQIFTVDGKNLRLDTEAMYPRICEFARKVKKEEHIQLNKEQICDLLAVYLSMRSNESLYTVYKYDEDVHHMTMELLEDMEGELGKSLTGDRELVERLGAHLNLMFDRMHLGTMADCSDLGQLKQEYPQIYKIIEKNIDAFSKRHSLFISEGERGYIIIHILASLVEQEEENQRIRAALLCMSGIGTSRMLAQRVKKRFPRIEIVKICSVADFQEETMLADDIDLILSTVKTEPLSIPMLFISPMPDEEEFASIGNACEKIAEQKLRVSFTGNMETERKEVQYQPDTAMRKMAWMEDILEGFSCQTLWAKNLEELYEKTAEELFRSIEKQRKFVALMRKRGEQGCVVFREGMLLLHGRMDEELGFRVYRVQGGVDCISAGKSVKVEYVVVMVAPAQAASELLELFSCISAELVQDDGLAEAIEAMREEEIFRRAGLLMSRDIFH